jgi:hypothetical protein
MTYHSLIQLQFKATASAEVLTYLVSTSFLSNFNKFNFSNLFSPQPQEKWGLQLFREASENKNKKNSRGIY